MDVTWTLEQRWCGIEKALDYVAAWIIGQYPKLRSTNIFNAFM